jgi:hypothetical protein
VKASEGSMWLMSTRETLMFIAVVSIAVALALLS